MKTIKELKIPAGDYKQIEIRVDYTLGGMNYFSGNVNKRGYKLYLTPCFSGHGMMSHTLLGSEHESGFYIQLEEVTRMNKKRMEYWWSVVEPLAQEIADLYSEKRYNEIIDLVGALHPTPPKKAEESTRKLLNDKLIKDTAKEIEDHFIVKFFNAGGTWYVKEATEYIMKKDGHEIVVHNYKEMIENKNEGWEIEDIVFFGYVELIDSEYGYFNLKELESVDKPMLWVERDKHFTATRCELITK